MVGRFDEERVVENLQKQYKGRVKVVERNEDEVMEGKDSEGNKIYNNGKNNYENGGSGDSENKSEKKEEKDEEEEKESGGDEGECKNELERLVGG